ncbi:MAG: hypothetical protein JXB48_14990 [Candidatus Latescibacteria bacterium]|nr:hypothetical protein [Candidatus Latescibacterota bacterium]
MPRYYLGLSDCVSILRKITVFGLFQGTRVSQHGYFSDYYAYVLKNITTRRQKMLANLLGFDYNWFIEKNLGSFNTT